MPAGPASAAPITRAAGITSGDRLHDRFGAFGCVGHQQATAGLRIGQQMALPFSREQRTTVWGLSAILSLACRAFPLTLVVGLAAIHLG
jgi:hypothetical protein